MEGKKLIERLKLTGFLSYGSEGVEIALEPLNVLIGPNASGKSNLLEAIAVLRSAPRDLTAPIREGGGVSEWLWKGGESKRTAEIEAIVDYPPGKMPLRYRLAFTEVGERFEVVDEAIEDEHPSSPNEPDVYFYYRFQRGHPVINVKDIAQVVRIVSATETPRESAPLRRLRREDLRPDQSVLSQKKDSDVYPEITYIGSQFESMWLFREWTFGRNTQPRLPQTPNLRGNFLSEDARNLAHVLNNLALRSETERTIMNRLEDFYGGIIDINVKISEGTVQVSINEKGLSQSIAATRLSDGMLRYLCLLTVLCHPTPPPLICVEEPELGLHPDILPSVAQLLIEASQRTQLIVTTHSDVLVSALSEVPESVVVCERDEMGTKLRRLEAEPLKEWLEKYSLGELWLKGEIGGTRW